MKISQFYKNAKNFYLIVILRVLQMKAELKISKY